MIPTIVIGGYLGAGKTTLVNHLLRHAEGRRIAVLVNDFGELAIDADLIEGAAGEVLALAGGCVCCSFGADLVGSLQTVAQRDPPPDVVLIETSGVGLPAAVARTARLAAGVSVEGIVVVLDGETVRERATDRYLADTVRQQLSDADLFVLNKTDLLDAPTRHGLSQWLAAMAPGVPVIPAAQAQLPSEVVLGLRAQPHQSDMQPWSPTRYRPPVNSASERFVYAYCRFTGPVDVDALAAEYSAPASGVLRAKGLVTGLDGQRLLLQAVGRRVQLTPAPTHAGAEDGVSVIRLADPNLRSA